MANLKEIIANDIQKLTHEKMLKVMQNQKIRHEWVLTLPKLIAGHIKRFLDTCPDEYFANPRIISKNRLIYDLNFTEENGYYDPDESPEKLLIHSLCEIGRDFRKIIDDFDNREHDDIFSGGFLECPHKRIEKLKSKARVKDPIRNPLPYDAWHQVGWCHREVENLLLAAYKERIPELKSVTVNAEYYPAEDDGCCGRSDTPESHSIKISLDVYGI